VRLGRDELRRQVEQGAERIGVVTGTQPTCFRAPGYTVTDEVFGVLRDLGVTYDVSVFPCPSYWSAKALAIGRITLRGRHTHSVLDTPRVLTAPTRPYFPSTPYWEVRSSADTLELVEIPVQVTRGLRLPFIGTSGTLAGERGAEALARMCVGEPVVNLELHGIDVLDTGDGLAALRPHQPDVRIPHQQKMRSIARAVTVLKNAGYTFVTMHEVAQSVVTSA